MPNQHPTDTDSPGDSQPTNQTNPSPATSCPPTNAAEDSPASSPHQPNPANQTTPSETPHFEYPPIWVPRPDGIKWLNSNQRLHHHAKAPITKAWREAAAIHANLTTSKPFPKPARIVAFITYDTRRRYDPNNLNPTTKPCIDGFVDAGLIPDDDHTHVIGPDHRHAGVDKHAPGVLFVITAYHPDHDWRPNT